MMLRLLGTLAKAYRSEDGKPHLQVLASGPELDKSGERMSQAAREKFAALAKAGSLPLVPSHDVPLPLALSVDGALDEGGHLGLTYAIDEADTLAMRLYKAVEAGTWTGQVSVGSPGCTRAEVFDVALGKQVREVSDFQADGAHVALTFPGRAAYPLAGFTGALMKALRADPAELIERGWPEDLAKAMPENPSAPTFATRYASKKLGEELPPMLDVLRWTVEDVLSPWTGGDKRALLAQTFSEFSAAVLGEADEAIGKSAPAPAPLAKDVEPAPAIVPEPVVPVVDHAAVGDAVAEAVAPLAKAVDELRSLVEGLQKTTAPEPTSTMPGIPPGHTTVDAPNTGLTADGGDPVSDVRKAAEAERETLRKAVAAERDHGTRTRLIGELNLLEMRLGRT